MKQRSTTLLAGAAVLVAALVTFLVIRDGDHGPSGNATDAAFVSDMVPHHEGAVEMAKLARTRADHLQIRAMATDVIEAQTAEISVMRRISDDFHEMNMHAGSGMGMSEGQMGMDFDMPGLERAKPFDRAFIDMMIPHHQGAIRMARVELGKGEQPALRQMAEDIIASQSREIDQMRQWRKDWYGTSSGSMDDSMMDG